MFLRTKNIKEFFCCQTTCFCVFYFKEQKTVLKNSFKQAFQLYSQSYYNLNLSTYNFSSHDYSCAFNQKELLQTTHLGQAKAWPKSKVPNTKLVQPVQIELIKIGPLGGPWTRKLKYHPKDLNLVTFSSSSVNLWDGTNGEQ